MKKKIKVKVMLEDFLSDENPVTRAIERKLRPGYRASVEYMGYGVAVLLVYEGTEEFEYAEVAFGDKQGDVLPENATFYYCAHPNDRWKKGPFDFTMTITGQKVRAFI